MKFQLRSRMRVVEGPIPKPITLSRAAGLLTSGVTETVERFIHEQLLRKRQRTLRD